ncbi:copper homeostasis periplasmic binding protein CopC [Bordetella sp. FB-8]|uniref:copper homeostasis periplasmic binding protein CopC n=1 Tax=Bordetella sp. FB-8 TaxID=1159870 RepID=UPI00036C1199|nr:copper homeostasis periplasmic binding protein CopC [Bordetella sp. FB-8]
MFNRRFIAPMLLATSTLSVAAIASAHPKLISSKPADNATAEAPQKIELHFSEDLVKQFSGASLVMSSMPGMNHASPMKMAAKVSGGDDPKTMLIVPAQAMMAGTYTVEWRAVSSDTHPITGKITFTAK